MKTITPLRFCVIFILIINSLSDSIAQSEKVPGTIVDYIDPSTKIYIGSPSIAILPDGSYVASHDHFGPGSSEFQRALTSVFRSEDKGKTWKKISQINGQFWSNLFVHKNKLYIMGTWKHHGNLIIRRSDDNGETWSEPNDSKTGLLREGEYHTAPMPMIIHNGRIWRAVENAKSNTQEWGKRYSAMIFSAPVDCDLLDADSWQASNSLPFDQSYLNGNFRGWLEGNAVVTPEGKMVDILRVATAEKGSDMAAIVSISENGLSASFDPLNGFFDFAGGARKFSIRYDERSGLYWTISNMIPEKLTYLDPSSVRNMLVLKSSKDLFSWNVNKLLLYHPDEKKHGFQYIDWQFDGKDIIYVSRTAYDDGLTGAANFHDANFLTFHRIKNFRKLSNKTISKNPSQQQ
jgi:hypothetical protein